MIVNVQSDGKWHKLIGFMYNSQGQFVPSALDWQELNYTGTILVVTDINAAVNLPTAEVWAGRKVIALDDTSLLDLSRTGV